MSLLRALCRWLFRKPWRRKCHLGNQVARPRPVCGAAPNYRTRRLDPCDAGLHG